jgi:hypothetical protein
MEQGDSLIVMDSKPNKAPPARFANKAAAVAKNSVEDAPIRPAAALDDIPIGGKAVQMKDGANPDELEDKPIPRGTYDLDKLLGAEAFGDPNGGDAVMTERIQPKKAPPARFAKKEVPKKAVEEEDKPIKPAAVNMDDIPIGKSAAPVSNDDPDNIVIPRGTYDLDKLLGEDAFGGPPPSSAPKKGPPARFGKPPMNEDEEMKDDSMAPPVRKPAAKSKEEEKKVPASKAAPAKTGAAANAGGAKGPSTNEDNVGEGLSKEDAEAKFIETFSADIVTNLEESKKWNEKQEGYKAL